MTLQLLNKMRKIYKIARISKIYLNLNKTVKNLEKRAKRIDCLITIKGTIDVILSDPSVRHGRFTMVKISSFLYIKIFKTVNFFL